MEVQAELLGAFALHQAGCSACLQNGGHKATGVGGGTRPSQKAVTGLHLATVGAQGAQNAQTQPVGCLRGSDEDGVQNDSAAGLVTICGLTAMSGGTPIMRKVCCTVSANTGAATSPP